MRRPILALLATCFVALPAGADWLVLRDGTRLETRGPWTEKGRLLVFTSATGELSSLRTEAIDLEASRRATATAAAAAVTPTSSERRAESAPPRREVRRITNADIPAGRVSPAGAAAAAEEEQGPTPTAAGGQLQVRDTAQRIDPFDSHLVVSGTLANVSPRTAAAVELTVQAYGADGEMLGSESATLGVAALTPGAATTFEADFADVYGSAMALRFAPTADFVETTPQDGSTTTAVESDDGFDDFDIELDEVEDEP